MATYCGVFVSDLERGDWENHNPNCDRSADGFSDELLSAHSEQENEATVVGSPSPLPPSTFYGRNTAPNDAQRRLKFAGPRARSTSYTSTPSGRPASKPLSSTSSSVLEDRYRTGRATSTDFSSAVSQEFLPSNTEGTPDQDIRQHLTTILSEVHNTNTRLDEFEDRLKSLEHSQQTTPCSSSGQSHDTPKLKIPPQIRVRLILYLLVVIFLHYTVCLF